MNPRRAGPLSRTLLLAALAVAPNACRAPGPHAAVEAGRRGTLLAIGGGLDDDNGPVFARFLELASAHGPARIVVATAATGDQEVMATGKIAALQTWCPGVRCEVIRRETPEAETVAAIDAATAMFFTGGDQKRITDRYRPGDTDTAEWLAMRRLLQRGGVIAGSSAGDAMMGESMFLTGRSAEALGAARPAPPGNDAEPAAAGPQMGPGMRFLPWLLTDSHFFERDRLGRLMAGLEVAGQRLGLGVGEDGCVEIDLATGVITGIAVSDALLVDVGRLERDGLARRRVVARLIRQGMRVSLLDRLGQEPSPPPRPTTPPAHEVVVEEGQNRQLASWRLFRRASAAGAGAWRLDLDGWRVTAWPDGRGEVVFDIDVDAAAPR